MRNPGVRNGTDTRQQILQAALKRFAHSGYAATSIQEIVDDARVTKPALYYYFPGKVKLYAALVDLAYDERFRLIQEAAGRGRTVAQKLTEIAGAVFEHCHRQRDLMRLAFASAFAAPGEMPAEVRDIEKGRRSFELVCSLLTEGQQRGELDARFDSEELAFGFYGQLNVYVMVRLLLPDCPLDRRTAEQVVKLFLQGAANPKARGEERDRVGSRAKRQPSK